MDAPTTRYVAVGEAEVAYQIVGEGPLDLVYHHGFCHLDLQWDVAPEAAFNERLAALGRLILFDRRGSGASERVARDHFPTWEDWSEDLSAVLDAAGSQNVAIFAEAEAGPTAILFAAAHPERVSALILGNTAARYASAEDYPIGMTPSEIDATVQFIEATWGTPEGMTLFPSLAGDEAVRTALARLCRAAATPRMAAALFRHLFRQLDVRQLLGLVQAPTLVLHNRGADAARARYLAAHIDGARLAEVPGDDYLFFAGDHEPVIGEVAEFLTGQRPPVATDRVLSTVLFTDIVGSTEQAVALGDRAWRDLLDRFRAMVREELHRFGGREVNTRGDDFLATFDGPARAINCATTLTDAATALGLAVRTGVHTGEVELMGSDIGGIAVHIGARVAALAGPREVLVSRTVTDLVAGSGIEFDDRGEHALKGVPGDWRLFAARQPPSG